ncbi:hypothetical protein JNK13_08050 [bacterium]|nr:hypothetical protein [bacterium]
MFWNRIRFIAFSILTFTVVIDAIAQDTAQLKIQSSAINKLLTQRSTLAERIDQTIPIGINSDKFGELQGVFSAVQRKNWNASFNHAGEISADESELVLLRGSLQDSQGNIIPVAGGIDERNGTTTLQISFHDHRYGERSYQITAPLVDSATDQVGMLEDDALAALTPSTCGSDDGEHAATQSASRHTSTIGYYETPIALYGDYELYLKYGVNANNQMALILNAAQTIYARDLRLAFNIVSTETQTSSTQPFTSTDSFVLLPQFKDYVNALESKPAASIFHLVTGKEIDSSIIGLAYTGVTCLYGNLWSYGLTQVFNPAIDHLTIAHEIGHNFGAPHDTALPYSLMYPALFDPAQAFFSATSQNDIATHLADSGTACLTFKEGDPPLPPEPPPPPPPSVSLAASFSKSRGQVTLALNTDTLAEACTIIFDGSHKSSFSSLRSQVVAAPAPGGIDYFYSRTGLKSIKKKSQYAYFRARLQCPSYGELVTNTVRVKVPRSKKRKAMSLSTWIKRVETSLTY